RSGRSGRSHSMPHDGTGLLPHALVYPQLPDHHGSLAYCCGGAPMGPVTRKMVDMAKSSANSARSKTAQPSKEDEKAAKAEQKAEKKQRRKQLWQVFKTQVKEDKRLLPYMIGVLVICAAIITFLGSLAGVVWWVALVFGVIIGVMLAMILFARRVQRSMY